MSTLAAAWRAARVLLLVLSGLLQIVFVFPRLAPAQRAQRVQAWAGQMLRRLGVQLEVVGTPPQHGPLLLVCNHISWLDILVVHAARHCRFIAKSDVRHWPLVGRLATGAGTLYIERASPRDALRVVHHMAQALQGGDMLAVFPEGTTSDGTVLLPFHANLIQAAISAPAPVLPLALRFMEGRTGLPSQAMSYIDDETLVGSVWRTLHARGLRARVVFGTPQQAAGRDRRAWARDLHAAVDALRAG